MIKNKKKPKDTLIRYTLMQQSSFLLIMKSEGSFISSDKNVYDGKFGPCCESVHVCLCACTLLSFRALIQQGFYIACNNKMELNGMLF